MDPDTRRMGSAQMQISYGKKGREGLETALRSEPRHCTGGPLERSRLEAWVW